MSYSDKIRSMVGAKPLTVADTLQRSKRGRRSRVKGKEFERAVAEQLCMVLFCSRFEGTLVIRRSSQAERAYEADLIIEAQHAPSWLLDMWVECENAKVPQTASKMEQSIRDAANATLRTGRQRTPVVIWREAGTRTFWFTTHHSWLDELLGNTISADHPGHGLMVTAELHSVLRKLRARL